MTQFDLDSFLPYQITLLAERMSREFSQLYRERYGISVPEWRVVAHLSQQGAVSVREICARVHLEKSRVSRAASRLEAAGYVTKRINRDDKRLITLSLTPRGQQMVDDLAPRAAQFEANALASLGDEAPEFRRLLAHLLTLDEG